MPPARRTPRAVPDPPARRSRRSWPALLGLLLVLPACARVGGAPFQPTQTGALPLSVGDEIGQTVHLPEGDVRGVDVLTATFDRRLEGALVVRLVLDGAVAARTRVDAEEVRDNAFTALRFDEAVPVSGAAALVFTWTGEDPVGLYANVPPDPLPPDYPGPNDPYAEGQLLLDGEPADGDLAFRVVGDPEAADVLSAIGDVWTSLLGRLDDRPGWLASWLALLGIAVLLAVLGLRPQLDEGRPDEQDRRREEGGP